MARSWYESTIPTMSRRFIANQVDADDQLTAVNPAGTRTSEADPGERKGTHGVPGRGSPNTSFLTEDGSSSDLARAQHTRVDVS